MTELHLLRHADAGDVGAWTGPDAERPLSVQGRAQAERLAAHLAAIGLRPDAIVSSPKRRAVETAEPLARALGLDIRLDDRLAGGCGLEDLAAILADTGSPEQPIVVGHDPDLSDVLSALVGAPLAMRKAAIARVDYDGAPRRSAGRLHWLLPPDVIPGA